MAKSGMGRPTGHGDHQQSDQYVGSLHPAFVPLRQAAENVPKQFDHAWGPATSKPYQDVAIPDFPPVHRALHLQSLVQQLREGANVENVPLIRCVFDVFVADMPEP